MSFQQMFFHADMLPRLSLAAAMMLLALSSNTIFSVLLLILLAVALLRFLDGGWGRIQRLVLLLRWFVIPILLLHAFLSSGQLIFPAVPSLSLTWEGLAQGLFLSLHLASIFLIAITVFQMLTVQEWQKVFVKLPLIGKELNINLLMLIVMKRNIRALLLQLRQQWSLRKSWRHSPQLLVAAFQTTLLIARQQAYLIWIRWPAGQSDQVNGYQFSLLGQQASPNLLCLAAASLALILSW